MGSGARIQPGALFMVGIPGPELDPETRRLLSHYGVGGVVLFRRNVRDVASLCDLTEAIHAVNPDRPPLVAIDHEGGPVTRLDEPFTKFPPAAVVGAAGSPHFAYREGVAIGEELRSVGIDIDFAPVLDVQTNPRNPVIGERSFGSHPRIVARLGVSFAHGLQRAGVIPVGKHFPGHGDTDVDSHLDLPVVTRSAQELDRIELFPFRRAILSGIDALMTAHIVVRALDPTQPATLSRKILVDCLRDRLHFRGVVFSDDLEMKAIADRYPPHEAALEAIEAGVDWVLFAEHLDKAVAAIEYVERAARRRHRIRERIEESAARIEALRKAYGRRPRRPVGPPPPELLERHRSLVRWIEERARSRAAAAG